MQTLNHTNNTDNINNTTGTIGETAAPRTQTLQIRPMTDTDDPGLSDEVRRAERVQVSPFPGLLKLAQGVVWIIWAVIACTAAVLAVAFVFRIAGANADASIVDWVYRSSDRAMRPFRGIFPIRDLGGESIFDASLLFAACAYVAGALILDGFRRWLGIKVERQERMVRDARAQIAAGR